MQLRFVHAADLHLDAPFAGIGEIDQEVSTVLQRATFAAFERVVSLCLDARVDFLVVAGDVYNSADRSLRAQLRFRDGLQKLSDARIPVFVAHGNHDPLSERARGLSWPDNLQVFPGDRVQSFPVIQGEKEVCRVYGISFSQPAITENLALRFQRSDKCPFAVGVLHCNLGQASGHEPYAPCELQDLVARDFDYWALGHVHARNVAQSQGPAVVYPGNIQGLNPREEGEKGCYLVTVTDGGVDLEFRPADQVRWFVRPRRIEELKDLDGLLDALDKALQELREDAGGRFAVVRFLLEGRGPLHPSLREPLERNDVLEHLRELGKRDLPWVWVESIEDRTAPAIDLEQRAQAQDFLGEFLRLAQSAKEEAEVLEELRGALSSLYQVARRSGLAQPDPEHIRELIGRAATLGADRLVGEGGS